MKDYNFFREKLDNAEDFKELVMVCLDGIFNLIYEYRRILEKYNALDLERYY